MSNHFHLVMETPEPTLSAGMQWLLATYSPLFNKRYGRPMRSASCRGTVTWCSPGGGGLVNRKWLPVYRVAE